MIRRIASNFLVQMFAMLAAIAIGVSAFVFGYVVPDVQQQHRQFIIDCKDQGGKYIKLSGRHYCIVDGQKIGF